jgi:hypothetical protein
MRTNPSEVQAVDLRAQLQEPADPRGVRITDALVQGPLDLAAFTLGFPLAFERCTFTDPVNVEGAELHSLALIDCTLPGMLANGLRVRRDVDLTGSTIAGTHHTNASVRGTSAVWLCESTIGGRLICLRTTIDGQGGRALQADRLQIAGSARFMHGFTALGEIRMPGARIGGRLEFNRVRLENPGRTALILAESQVGGGLFLIGEPGAPSQINGQVVLTSMQVTGGLFFRDISIEAPADLQDPYGILRNGVAVHAARLSVDSDLVVGSGSIFNGELSLPISDLGGIVFDPGARLHSPGARALDLTNAEVRSRVDLGDQVVRGRIRMPRAHIQGRLYLGDAQLSDPEKGVLLDGYGLTVDGNVEMPRLRADGGQIVLVNLTCRDLFLPGAQLSAPGGPSLTLRSATIRGDLSFDRDFRSEGLVNLDGVRADGRFSCHSATFIGSGPAPETASGDALSLFEATIAAGVDLRWAACSPRVDASGLTTSSAILGVRNWPATYRIGGFRYERLGAGRLDDNPWNDDEMGDWLDGAVFDAGAYEHAAQVFKQHGYGAQAEHLLIRGRDQASRLGMRGDLAGGNLRERLVARPRHGLDWLYGRAVGYGYRPGRALIALILLLFAVLFLVSAPALQGTLRTTDAQGSVYSVDGAGRGDCSDGHVRCFNSLFYAVDTVVPLVSLNQRSTWYPDARARWGTLVDYSLNIATLMGWILSTIVVLSFARLARTT